MRPPPTSVFWLSLLTAGLAVAASIAGLVMGGRAEREIATSVRGEDVELYGEGLYRYDTVFIAAGSRATDVVTLALAVPLLALASYLYRRRSPPGALLLAGALAYFLYVYANRSLGNAYNELFLLYVATFSLSLFALVSTLATIDLPTLRTRLSVERPRKGLAAFLVACGLITTAVWLTPLVAALAAGDEPRYLDTYTTPVTEALDLGVLVPSLFLAAVLILRRSAFGYVVGAALLVLLVIVAATIVVSTAFQVAADISFTTGEIVGPIAGFVVLAAIAVWLLVRLLRDVDPRTVSLGSVTP